MARDQYENSRVRLGDLKRLVDKLERAGVADKVTVILDSYVKEILVMVEEDIEDGDV